MEKVALFEIPTPNKVNVCTFVLKLSLFIIAYSNVTFKHNI